MLILWYTYDILKQTLWYWQYTICSLLNVSRNAGKMVFFKDGEETVQDGYLIIKRANTGEG